MKDVLQNLQFSVFDFEVVFEREALFREFKGNIFRGALGKTLRNLTCSCKGTETECFQCLVRENCIYSKIFESFHPEDNSILGKVENAPHPFILFFPDSDTHQYDEHSSLYFSLTLVGQVKDYIPYFILAFEDMGKKGIGNLRTPFKVVRISTCGQDIYFPHEKRVIKDFQLRSGQEFMKEYEPLHTLTLELVTPVRLKFDKHIQKFITFEMIMRNLLRRIQLLSAIYCAGPGRVDFTHLIELSREIKVKESRLHWEEQKRFSFRQDKTVGLGGVSGHIVFEGNLTPFLPFLELGEILHVGKGTAFGLGKIAIHKGETLNKEG